MITVTMLSELTSSGEMTPLPFLFAAVFLSSRNVSFKVVHGRFFLQQPPWCSRSLSEISKNVIEVFWDDIFMVRNTIKTGQPCCSAVICRKLSALETQFHLMEIAVVDCSKQGFDNYVSWCYCLRFINILVYLNK